LKDNILTEFKETEWEGVDRIHLTKNGDPQQAPVNAVMDLQFP
jgi:hypothetical protein